MKLKLMAILLLTLLIPVTVAAENKVVIEAFGFFNHFPMQSTRSAIEETCAKFGDQVELTLYDEDKPDGQAFMQEKGMSGHIPMRLFLNGENTVTIDEREVSFSDFVGYAWKTDDLERAISLALEGSLAASDGQNASGGGTPILPIAIAVGVVMIALTGFFLFKPKKKAKGKS